MNNTPKLRFKEFSGEWNSKKGKDLFESISDKNHKGDLEVLSATQDRGVIPRSELNIDIKFEQNNLTSYKKVKESDFIISLRSFQGGIEHSHYTGLVSPAYTVFNFKNNIDLNHRFFAEIFKTQNFINKLNTLTYGIRDGKAISFKDFSDVKLSFPKKEEQEKIASFFSLIDDKISLQSDKVEALKDYKKGIMQKIFSRELRFKDDDGRDYPEWEEKKLGNITSIGTGSNDLQDKVDDGKYPFFVRSANIEKINTYTFDGEAILIPGDGNIGKIYHYINGKFAYHQRVYKISDFADRVSGKYIYYYMSRFFLKEALKNSVKATVDSLRLPTLTGMNILLPSIEEQEKITRLLNELEVKVEKEEEKLNYLNEYKKGLLQQIFV